MSGEHDLHRREEELPQRSRKPTRALLITLLGVMVVALVVGMFALLRPPATADEGPAPLDLERTEVLRGDLIETIRVQGTLGHGTALDLGTALDGTLTAIPSAGTVVGLGDELFRIDDLPVVLLHGELPAWRAFSTGMSNGNDVLQLEKSLAKLGYFRLTPDTNFTAATKTAVKYWQKSLGLKQTGSIEHGRVIFSSTDVRVFEAKSKVGTAASGEILSATGVKKQISVFLETSQQALAKKKTAVIVSLPGGASEKGTVVSVGAPVEKEGNAGPTRKIPVSVELVNDMAADELADVPVGVQFTSIKAKDVLQIPASALLAQPGGGFAVEVSQGENILLVPVKTGVFANGLVEVLEGDLRAGDSVVVAK